MNFKVTIRPILVEDLPLVARLHLDSFPDSALTKLGPAIVERYYQWQLAGPHRKVHAVAAFVAAECAGFSFSGIFSGSTSGFIRRYRANLITAVLRHPHLIFNERFLKRLGEGIRLLTRQKKLTVRDTKGGTAEPRTDYGILSIAVAPRFQKSGIGQRLMLDAEAEALKYGCRELCLTVHPENTKAVRFYEKQEWRKLVTAGLWNGAMVKTLKETNGIPL